jgi:hypothetical protein
MKVILHLILVGNQFIARNFYNYNYNPDLDDDDSLMRQVLAMSQIEYVETLKKQQEPLKSDDPSSSDTHPL